MSYWNGLIFFKLFKLYFHLGLIMTPHVFYVHMTYVYSFSHVSFFTRSHDQEKSLSYYDLFDFGVLLIYGHTLTLIFLYFLCNSTTPILPVYVDQRRPTWRRIPPGCEVWSSGRSRLYLGGLTSLQTRHCQGRMGPSIKEVSMAGWTMLSGTLTGLGKVRPPIVVRRVVPTQS